MSSSATPHRASLRSTRGSSYFVEDDNIYDSIPTRQSAGSSSRHGTRPAPDIHVASVGLQVTGEIPYVVQATVGLMDQWMVLQNQPGYSNPPISPGDTILNVDGMAASHASVEQLCAMLNGPIHSVVHLTLARRTGELFTACLLRHTLPESKAPSTGGSRSAGDSQQSNPPPAFFDIQGLQADESLLVQKPENPNMARSAPQTAARAAQQRQAFENVSSEVVYTAPASSPESYYFVAPQFGRVLQKSGVMWRRGDSTESLRNATGSWWDLGSEKCACTLEGGYFNIRSIADKAIEDSLELSQWTMDDSDDRMGGHMTLIHISTGRLVKLFAESDQAGEDWRRAILQCMPKSIPPVTSLMDSRSEIPEMHVPATIAGQVPRSSRAAPPVVASGLTISHQYISNAVDPAYRESRLRDMQYARTYGTLRCCFAHWKVFGLKSVVGVTVEAYRPADEAHKVEALLVGDLIAIRGSNGEGMSRGWHLPNDRWDALAKYPREIWFPTNSVSVECDASGYWGRVWPLTINVLGARHLPSQGGKKRPDPYVTVQVGNMRHEIDRRNKTSNPVWVELVEFEVEGDEMVSFVVWDWNDVKRDETIGFLEISAGRLVQDGEVAFEESVSQSRPSDKDPQAFAIFPGTKGYKLFTENGSEVQGPNNDEALLFVQAFPQAKSSNVSNAVHTMQDLSGCFQDHASDSMANALVLKTEEPQDIKVMHTPDQRHAPAPVTETMLELHANTLLMANDKISSDSIEESSSRWTVGIISISGQNSVFELCVEDFEAGSSAAYAGLQAGDVIIQVENVDIKGVEAEEAERLLIGPAGSFVTITASRRTDDKISMHTVELMRDVPVSKMLKYREVANKVGEKTSEKTSNSDSTVAMASAGPFKIVRLVRGETGSIGMTIVPAGPNVDGAGLWKIANLLPDSPAYQSGQLKVGDIIRAIDQECRLSGNVEDVISILKGQPGTPVSIEVQSGDAPPLPQHVQNDHVNIEFKLPKWAEEFAFADPVPKEYTFKIWIISAQHQPTKNFMGQGMRMIKLSTCDANGVSGISFEASYRNNKEHPIIEQGCFLHFNETYAYLQVAVDEVGKCSLSVEQLKDVAKASLPRSAQRDMTQQSEIKSSKSLTKSLSKSLSFKKAQSALERQAEIFESYPGAFALHLVQEDGEPLKNKKGEIPAIYLHVVKTWETPDLVKTYETPEAHLAEPSEEHQQVSRRGSETSFAAKEMQMKAEKEEVEKIRMQTQLTEEQMSMDLERLEQDMDRKISQVPDPSLQDSPAVTRLPEVIERTVNDSQSARPQNVSQASTPSPGVPIKAPSSPSPVPTSPLGRPSKRLSAGVEDMTRIFGERANVRGPEPHGDSGRSPRLLDDSASAKKGEFDSASAKKGEFFEICRQGERGSYPVVLELECKHLPRSEFSRSSFVCLLQVGDLYFQTSTTSSGAFQDGNIFKFVLQTDEVVQVAVVDLNRTMMDNVIGHASMPAEKLVHDFGQQSEFQILRSDGLGVMDGKTRRASLVVARCRPCAPAEMDEALKAGIVTEKGYKPVTPRDAQQIISNKISIFDGREDFCRQRLYLKIVAARHITFRSNLLRFCNPYCKVRIGEQRFQTHKCIATIEPDWCGDTFDLEVVSRKDQLQIQVLDWDMLEMDRVIGYVKVPIGQLLRETIEGNKKAPSKTTSSSSVAWTGKNISSSSAFDKSSHGSAAFEKAVSTSSAAFSENSDDSSNRASYKLFTADGAEVRSWEGMSAYLVLKLSTEPFSDVVDEPAEEAVKQAWDINGFAKAERPKAGQIQRSAAPPAQSKADMGLQAPELFAKFSRSPGKLLDDHGKDIKVSVIACADLPQLGTHGTVATFQFGNVTNTTKLNKNMIDPYFGEEFRFSWSDATSDMTVTIKQRDDSGDQIVGWVCISRSSMEDFLRRSKMEEALSGLSFLRPSSPVASKASDSRMRNAEPLDISQCAEVSEVKLQKMFPGMRKVPLQCANASKHKSAGEPSVFLRFESVDCVAVQSKSPVPASSTTEQSGAPQITYSRIPSAEPEAPVVLALSFAEDIVPLTLDSNLLSEWGFAIHRDLAMTTGEHQARFEIMSTDIKDVVTLNLVIRPMRMLPHVSSTKTARDLADEINAQVCSMESDLRRHIPTLFRVVDVGDQEEANTDNEFSFSDDMGSSVESLDENSDRANVMIDFTDMIQSEDEPQENAFSQSRAIPHASRAAAPLQTSPNVTRNALDTVEAGQKALSGKKAPWNLKSLVPQTQTALQGAELYSAARQCLGSRDKKEKEVHEHILFHQTLKGSSADSKRSYRVQEIFTAWAKVHREGVMSNAISDVDQDENGNTRNSVELPQPTFFFETNGNHGAVDEKNKDHGASLSRPKTSPSAHKPEKAIEDDDDDDIPSVWVKLFHHISSARNRRTKERFILGWIGALPEFSPTRHHVREHRKPLHASEDREAIGRSPIILCAHCGMAKRQEKMETIDTWPRCLKCARKGGAVGILRGASSSSTPSELDEEHESSHSDREHRNAC